MRPTYAEIRLGALAGNYRRLRNRVRAFSEGGLIAVVKADAYGHGMELCARALVREGAKWLGVTSVEEATALRGAVGGRLARQGEPETRVLVMSGFFPGEEGAVLRERAGRLSQAGRLRSGNGRGAPGDRHWDEPARGGSGRGVGGAAAGLGRVGRGRLAPVH